MLFSKRWGFSRYRSVPDFYCRSFVVRENGRYDWVLLKHIKTYVYGPAPGLSAQTPGRALESCVCAVAVGGPSVIAGPATTVGRAIQPPEPSPIVRPIVEMGGESSHHNCGAASPPPNCGGSGSCVLKLCSLVLSRVAGPSGSTALVVLQNGLSSVCFCLWSFSLL